MKYKIFIMSNKGGVGKTTVAVNLAYSLSEEGYKVGLLDIDIHGPNAPEMLGLKNKRVEAENEKIVPVKFNDNLYIMSIAFLTENQDQPVIWRGPLKTKLINQFIEDVKWPKLDFLVVDLPPGTGDETITIMQILKEDSGSIIVSTPQKVSVMDARKAITVSKKFDIPIIGLIENMSGDVFGIETVEKLAENTKVTFLGKLSMDKTITDFSNKGKPFMVNKKIKAYTEFKNIIEKIKKNLKCYATSD